MGLPYGTCSGAGELGKTPLSGREVVLDIDRIAKGNALGPPRSRLLRWYSPHLSVPRLRNPRLRNPRPRNPRPRNPPPGNPR